MKKLNKSQMILTTGGTKCIYHVISSVATFTLGPISWGLNAYFGNYRSTAECFNNSHSE